MLKRTCLLVLAAVAFVGSSCPPQQGGSSNPDNALVPRLWDQAYGNKQSTGFNAVHTQYALPALQKWTAPVGPSFSTFPVIGPDGVIWNTNSNGELVGVNPDGSPNLRRKLDDTIVTSAAINSDTYEIFVVGQHIIDPVNPDFSSRIYRLNSGVALLNVSSEPLKTGAAPKLWSNFLFLNSGGTLKVFDQTSLLLVGQVDTTTCFNLVCGSSDITDAISDFFGTLADCITQGGCPFSARPVGEFPFEPSVAIFDQAAIVGDTNKPIIIALSPFCASAFRFYPAADGPGVFPAFDHHFELLWSHALVDVDCDFKTVHSTSPVALPGSAVVFGDENGRVLELDALTGDVLFERKLNEPIQCPPVSGLRQIYVVESNHLATLDSNGVLISEVPLVGFGQGAALSLDFVYVATTNGLHTFGITPEQGFVFTPVQPANPAAAYIALGKDGTLYVSAHNRNSPPDAALVAYSTTGTIARAIAFPAVTWQAPADGATITSAPGKALTAAVSGPGGGPFDGTVTFTSNLDGTLCENVIPSNETATCTTSKAFTIGSHTLSAFATDASGGTLSAAITVTVVDTPPIVTITSPTANAVFQQGSSITFTASATDPDQASFTPDKIQWQSSIDGAIGTGLSFTKALSLATHTITATATDSSGMTGSASVTIQVTKGPAVTIQQPAEGAILFSGSPITFSATVTDPTEPSFPASGIQWKSNLDGSLGTGTSVMHALSNGNHTITVTATDTHGLSGQAGVHVTVQPPVQ